MFETGNLKIEHSEGLNSGDGSNWYIYANNNPLRFVDPTGLEIIKFETKTMQKYEGNLPNTNIPISKQGCTFSAMTGVINDYRSKNGMDAVDWQSKLNNNELGKYFSSEGELNRGALLNDFTEGKLAIDNDTKTSGDSPTDVINGVANSEDDGYVLGRSTINYRSSETGEIEKSEHEVGIAGIEGASIEDVGTSDNDARRDYSTDDSGFQVDRVIVIKEVQE